jgi:chromosome segregation ATPase
MSKRSNEEIAEWLGTMCPVSSESDGSLNCCRYHEAAAALREAETRIEGFKELRQELEVRIVNMRDDIEAAESRLAALREYVQHDPQCLERLDLEDDKYPGQCNCGLDDLLKDTTDAT